MNKALAEQLYYKEEERKAELLNLLNFILAILGLALGLFAFYVNTYLLSIRDAVHDDCFANLMYWGLTGFLVLDFCMLTLSIYFVVKAFHNHTFAYIPSPHELRDRQNELLEHFNTVGSANVSEFAEAEFETNLTTWFLDSAQINDGVNQTRKKYAFIGARFTVISVIVLGLTIIPFIFTPRDDVAKTRITQFDGMLTLTQPHTITNSENTKSSTTKKEQVNDRQKQTKASPAPAPAGKANQGE